MLPRSHRLRHTKQIQATLRTGTCFSTVHMKVCFSPSQEPTTRIACVVGKTVNHSAVRRHTYQRWLRATARQLLREYPLPQTYNMVWLAQPGIKAASGATAVFNTLLPRWQKLRATL